MKVLNIPIPEWAEGRRIVVIAGIECLADWNPAENAMHFKLKDGRCSQCGECCRNIKNLPAPYVDKNKEGTCNFLKDEPGQPGKTYCELGSERCLLCCADSNDKPPSCTISHTLKTVEDIS